MYRFKFALMVLIIFAFGKNLSFAQSLKAENIKSENFKDQVIISYDLVNPDENTVLVDLVMKKKTDKSFRYQPKYLSGDLGEGTFNGYERKIVWNKQKERLPMINMDDFYFEINVKVISGKKNTWLWVGAGAAVLGGGAALYFLLKDNGSETTSQNANMPQPPGRP